MKKVVIPTILAATILVAGMFAMMPVQKASTIHSSLGSSPLVLTATINPAAAATDAATWTVGQPFCIKAVVRTGGAQAGALDVAPFVVSTNLTPGADVPLVINDAAGAASVAASDLLNREAAGVIENPICGTTTVTVQSASTAGVAADTNLISVLVETRGNVAAPAAVLS